MGNDKLEQARRMLELAIDSSDDIPTFLSTACGTDSELAEAVSQLLNPEDAARLRTMASEPNSQHRRLSEGDKIGLYTINGILGEGGFGIVYHASQDKPVRREVALKILKPGMDSGEVVTRFEAERQALAVMEHHAIAQVYDAGTTKAGLPYFVMELVEGMPLNRFVSEGGLNLPAILSLFIKVCEGVQHAHQKGIIHRDLKPSNVLIRPTDIGKEEPEVKIIDFGIAKAIGQSLTDETIMTLENRILGTPCYMSPEQASGDTLRVDTRSDVYALGVMLYELLSGSPPISKKEAKQAAVHEVLRMIREEEPAPPSSRIGIKEKDSEIKGGATSTITYDGVKGELDWVTMRALEKEPDRRYGSAAEFAEDLRRYLRNEPVDASPPSKTYRLRKLISRNRLPFAAAALTILSIIAASIFAIDQAVKAKASEKNAIAARNEAQGLVDFMLTDLQEELAPIGRLDILQSVLDRAGKNSSVVTDDAHSNTARLATLRSLKQQIYISRLKFDLEAIHSHFVEADSLIEKNPELLNSLEALNSWAELLHAQTWAYSQEGKAHDSIPAIHQLAESLSTHLETREQSTPEYLRGYLNLAGAYHTLLSLSVDHQKGAQRDELTQKFNDVNERLEKQFGETSEVCFRMLKYQPEKTSEWIKQAEKHIMKAPEDAALLTQFLIWAPDETAIKMWSVIEEPLRRAAQRDPSNHALRSGWANHLTRMSYTYFRSGRSKEASALVQEAVPHFEAVIEGDPDLWRLKSSYARVIRELSRTNFLAGNHKIAAESGEKATVLTHELITSMPTDSPPGLLANTLRSYLFSAHHHACGLGGLGKLNEAAEVCRDMIAQLPSLIDQMNHDSPGFFDRDAFVYVFYLYQRAWNVEAERGNLEEAIRLNQEALDLMPEIARDSLGSLGRIKQASLLTRLDRLPQAEDLAEAELVRMEEREKGNIGLYEDYIILMDALNLLTAGTNSNFTERLESLSKRLEAIVESAQWQPDIRQRSPNTSLLGNIAESFQNIGEFKKAERIWDLVWQNQKENRTFYREQGLESSQALEMKAAAQLLFATPSYEEIERIDKISPVLEASIHELERLLQFHPDEPELWKLLHRVHMRLFLLAMDYPSSVEPTALETNSPNRNLPTSPTVTATVIKSLTSLCRQTANTHPDFIEHYSLKVSDLIVEKALSKFGEDKEVILAAIGYSKMLIELGKRAKKLEFSQNHAEMNLKLAEKASSLAGDDLTIQMELAIAHHELASVIQSNSGMNESIEHYVKSLEILTIDAIPSGEIPGPFLEKMARSAALIAIDRLRNGKPEGTRLAEISREWFDRVEAQSTEVNQFIQDLVRERLTRAEEAAARKAAQSSTVPVK